MSVDVDAMRKIVASSAAGPMDNVVLGLLDEVERLASDNARLRGDIEVLRGQVDTMLAVNDEAHAECERLRAEVVKLGTTIPQEAIDAINMTAVDEALALREQLAAVTAARDEACKRWEGYALRYGNADAVEMNDLPRISALRKVGQ